MLKTVQICLLLAMSFLLINCSEMGSWDLIEKQKNQTDPVAWKKRIQLTFQNAASTENLVNFPVLIKLTTARITYSLTVSGGEYIRIYDSDTTTELAFEIESWDPNGDSYIWVKVPQIDASSNTDHIWIYYDNVNSLADGQNETVVWTNLYEAVWHLNESGTGTRFDATENLNDGTPGGYEGDEAITGQVGGADEFDNIDDNIAVSSINSYVSLTFEAWIKRNGTGDWDAIINYDGWNSGGIHWQIYSSNVIGFSLNGSNPTDSFSTYTITDTSWHYIVNTYDSTANTDKFYLDGQFSSQTNYTTAISAGLDSFRIGGWSGGRTFNGAIDEVRISNTARSADWIKAQYNSMTDAYISYGSEESLE